MSATLTMIDALTAFINDTGHFAPLYYVSAFVLAALIPVIPTPLVAALGGTAFGYGPAAVYGTFGLALGAAVSLLLGRTVGRPLLRRMVDANAWDRWEVLLGVRSPYLWGVFFFLTNLDFVVCLAGLSKVPLPRLWAAALVARLPWLLASVWFGDAILVNDGIALLMLALFIPGLFLLNRLRPRLQAWLLALTRFFGSQSAVASDVAEPRVENVAHRVPQ